MPTTIKLKNSVTTTNAPSSLAQGEVAINITDKKVWVGNAATTPIQLLGAGSSASFGALTCTSLTNSGLTSGRVTYATTAGLLTDSANLTFNGTTLTAAALTSTGVATFSAGTVSAPAITTTGDTNTGIFFPAADTIAFTEGGVESMRIDSSGNVGINTSSLIYKLEVNGTGRFNNVGSGGGTVIFGNNLDGGLGTITAPFNSAVFTIANTTANPIAFNTGGTERMRIDSSGNVGIGTTTIGSGLSFGGRYIGNNGYANAIRLYDEGAASTSTTSNSYGFGFISNGILSYTAGTGGTHAWFTANTERMRIDSSGNVAVGTTSTGFNSAGLPLVIGSGSGNTGTTIFSGNASAGSIHFADGTSGNDSFRGYVNYNHSTNSMQFGTDATERMRITSGGDVGIGQSSPVNIAGYTIQTINNSSIGAGVYLQSNGTTIGRILNTATDFFVGGVSVSSACILQSGSAERMRITSSGDVLTGSTTTAGTTNPTAINLVGRLRSTQGQTASIANGATVDITLTYPRATVAYLIQSSVNTGNSSAGLFWSNDNGASSTFTLFGQNQNNVAVTSPAAGTIRITNNTGGTCAFNYAFTIIAGL